MKFHKVITIDTDELDLCASPAEIGEWMLLSAMRVWYGYDDNGTFRDQTVQVAGSPLLYEFADPDEGDFLTITAERFFAEHVRLIWLGNETEYADSYVEFATRAAGADADEYDDNTVDAVFQTLMYGGVMYG